MKKLVLLLAVFALSLPLAAGTLWYNGDFDGRNGLSNEINTVVSQSNVYDDFIVPSGQTWTINTVWSNDLIAGFTATTAEWEIRSGVSEGNGGTLIASGTDAATQTATGRSGFGFTEYTIAVSGLSVTLGPGTYWLTVAPIDSGAGRSFISTTSGANCVGTPCGNDGNSFINSSFFGYNFNNTDDSNVLGPGTWDFSMGVAGTSTGVIPEPASLGLFGLGVLGFGVLAARRRAAR